MRTANTRALLSWGAVLVLALAMAVTLWPPASAQEGEPADPDTFAVESYAQVCARCHGLAGTGGNVPGGDGRPVPALAGNPDVTIPYLDLVMLTGRMPPVGDPFDNREREIFYTDAERAAMVAYMAREFGIEGELPTVEEGQISVGLETFARNCAHCHGNAGAGGTAGQQAFTPRVNNLPPLAIAEAIRVGPFEMPAFSAEVISQEEVNGIAAYLSAVEEEQGTPLLGLVELNPVFASGFVGVLAIALLLSLLYIGGRPVPFEHLVADTVDADPAGKHGKAETPEEENHDG